MTDIDITAARIVEALKYDERIWRAYQTLKTCHQEGLIDALLAATEPTAALQSARAEVERLRDDRDELFTVGKSASDMLADLNQDLLRITAERDAARAECEVMRGRLARAEMHSSVAVTAADSLRESVARHIAANSSLSARVLELEGERDAASRNSERVAKDLVEWQDKLQSLRDCGQDGACAIAPGCVRHWEERNRELTSERDEWRTQHQNLVEVRRADLAAVVARGEAKHEAAVLDAVDAIYAAEQQTAEKIAAWLDSDRWSAGPDIANAIRSNAWRTAATGGGV